MDFQHFSGSARRFEIFATVVTQTKIQPLADCGVLDNVGVPLELIAYCGSNEIGPVRVETLLHHEVDLTEVNVTEIDRDLLAVSRFWAELMHIRSHVDHPFAIYLDGIWMVQALCARGDDRGECVRVGPPCLNWVKNGHSAQEQ